MPIINQNKNTYTMSAPRLQDMIDERILLNRKIFLWGQVDDSSARHVVDRLLYLELRDPGKEIQLIINSPGGYVTSGFSIYDTMKSISSPVSTICSGFAASMASIISSAGAKGRRFVLKHSRVMIHQPSGGTGGNAANIEIQAAELLKTKEQLVRILAQNCGQPEEKILKDFNRDHFMSAEESMEYGIADAVLEELVIAGQ